ncbi:MAG TPA: 23S rRNA (adenine(2503)-C(2))-methyltransferase RlmN [Chitinophagales bacterium]|nr:23S rRNA (adenine(2503)-C(2))-methyltransferase RlmN [Chitinophagales bacterium]HRH53024.1 23S rRNA (adenine(2503)-C(2))-methyltransferase RlmN [Chitinophagales bacterium]
MQAPEKISIRDLSLEQLTEQIVALGEPSFRAKQIYEWLWKKSAVQFSEMLNLSKSLREQLESHYTINAIVIDVQQKSMDGTIKCRFKLVDGHMIEGVLIPSENRMTACVSSQVGCNLGCTFCATGFIKMKRNLEPYEIYDQVVLLNKASLEHHKQPLTNIVFMGMGEPLLNYNNVLAGIAKITGEDGLHISAKRITVSTAGLAKMIRKLADDQVKFNLALSLHAADDIKRSKLMPINEANNLNDLVKALNYFHDKTGNRITFEYILFDGINESMEDAKNLVTLCSKVPARVNIIEYNTIREADFHKSKEDQREKFIAYLETHRVVAKVRRSRGKDIDAACGQLANK